jgi:hypothetical protein
MALGDAIFVQLNQAITGYGNKGDVLAVTETVLIEAMVTNGLLTIVATAGPVLPSNAFGELAYAENNTGVVTALPAATTVVLVPGCVIVVPASNRPVYLEAEIFTQNTSAQAGFLGCVISETTSGGPVILKTGLAQDAATVGTASKFSSVQCRKRLGVTSTVRTFALYAQAFGDAAGLTANVLNTASSPSSIGAYAR